MGHVAASQDAFRAIADPGRRRMLDAMRDTERTVGELTRLLGVSQPAVSQHLKVLKLAGLVDDRADGRFRLYRARGAALHEVSQWLAKYEAFWTRRLDALADHLARGRH